MIEEEEKQLLRKQKQPQRNNVDYAVHIKNVRIQKQLEYLQHYDYNVQVNSKQQTVLTFRNFYKDSKNQHTNHHTLTIFLPAKYPFSQPYFSIDKKNHHQIQEQIQQNQKTISQTNLNISQLLQQWSPKYKVCEMIQLIQKKLQQKALLDTQLQNNALYAIVRNITNNHKEFVYLSVVFLLAVIVRVLVGYGGYSGYNDWPNLGDFEAHRNWMSITVNKPIKQWYYQEMEEPWWRIDYPPIAAYISYIFGIIYNKFQPSALLIQEGYQSDLLKAYMRFTSLIIDILFMIPPNILLFKKLQLNSMKYSCLGLYLVGLFILLIKPDQILIDHGHFQYNSITMGCILYAFYFLLTKKYYLCCIFFTVALNCKQMAIYFALAFLGGLIGLNFHRNKHFNKQNRTTSIIIQLLIYAFLVIGTTVLIWLPWLTSLDDFKNVLSAIFPIHRGLYQLKVPNFWCISDTFFKWQSMFSKSFLMFICLSISIIMSLPAIAALIIKPTQKIILLGFSAISMTFFIFSYHGHEKSILLPLIMSPFITSYISRQLVTDVIIGGCVGIYHLLVQDGQTLSYYVLIILYLSLRLSYQKCQQKFESIYGHISKDRTKVQNLNKKIYTPTLRISYNVIIFICLHAAKYLIPPPQSLPYLYNLLFAFYSFVLNIYYLTIIYLIIFEEINSYLAIKGKKRK